MDAYITKEAIDFYSKNGFQFFSTKEKERCEKIIEEDTNNSSDKPKIVVMWFDLLRVKTNIKEKPSQISINLSLV